MCYTSTYKFLTELFLLLSNSLATLCTCVKGKVQDLGTKADECRRSMIWVDSEERQNMVERAWEWIFQRGRAVTSDVID